MATYYWVGGSGTWDGTTTTNWSLSSGGAGGAGVPTSADNVVFDVNSNVGTGAFTVTTSGSPVCNNFTASGLDGAMTLTVSAALSVYGNFTAPASNFSVTSGTVAITFVGSGTQTVTSNGVTLTTISMSGTGTLIQSDAMNLGTRSLTINSGTFDTGGYNFTGGSISQSTVSTNAIAIKLNNSTVTLSGRLSIYYSALCTFNAGTSSIVLSGVTPYLLTYDGPAKTFYNVSFTNTSTIDCAIYAGTSGTTTFNNLTFTSPLAGAWFLNMSGNIAVNGTLTLPTGNAYITRCIFYSFTGTTINAAAISGTMTDVDFANITVTGPTAPWSGTRLGDGGGNSGITGFAAPKTVYYSLAAGGNWYSTAWATSSGGTPALANFPLAQDTCIFDNNSVTAGNTVSVGYSYLVGPVDFSTRTTAMTLSMNNALTVNGNFTMGSGVTMSGTNTLRIGRSDQTSTMTTAGKTITAALSTSAGPSGTVTFADNYTGAVFGFDGAGFVNMNGKTFSISVFRKIVPGTIFVTLGGATITSSSNINFMGFTSFNQLSFVGTCTLNVSSASAKSMINSGCVDMSGFTIVNTGAGALTFVGQYPPNTSLYGTYGDLQTTVRPETVNFTASQMFQFNAFTISGTAGNLVTLQSNTAGTQAYLVSNNATVSTSYCSIKDLAASGFASWQAYTTNGNVDAGNNTGWQFSAPSFTAPKATEALRSFTEHWRFQ